MNLSPEVNTLLGLTVVVFFFRLPVLIRLTLHRLCSRRRYLAAWFATNFILGGLGLAGAFLILGFSISQQGFSAGFWTATSLPVLLLITRNLLNSLLWYKKLNSRRKD
jgi:hypothetical protein